MFRITLVGQCNAGRSENELDNHADDDCRQHYITHRHLLLVLVYLRLASPTGTGAAQGRPRAAPAPRSSRPCRPDVAGPSVMVVLPPSVEAMPPVAGAISCGGPHEDVPYILDAFQEGVGQLLCLYRTAQLTAAAVHYEVAHKADREDQGQGVFT